MPAQQSHGQPPATRHDRTPKPQAASDAVGRAREASSVIVDEGLNIQEFVGHVGGFLELPQGEPRLNLLAMGRPGLKPSLAKAIRRLRAENRQVVRDEALMLAENQETRKVQVEISRLPDPAHPKWLRVSLEDLTPDKSGTETPVAPQRSKSVQGDRVRNSEVIRQLLATTESLEAVVEEQEANAEKLRRAHFDLESAHCQLEAANEELDQLNTELRAANETLESTIQERDRAEEERRRLEGQMQAAQKWESLGMLAGGIAHDFNNILTTIIGNTCLILEESAQESPLRSYAEQIERAGQHATDLVRQILAYSGREKLAVQPLDLSTLVRDMMPWLETAVSKKVQVRCQLPADLPAIEADATQVRQILMNLVGNASDATGDAGGEITVTTGLAERHQAKLADVSFAENRRTEGYVYLEVRDTGCGMGEETRAQIFDPFFTTKATGRGLGLAAVLGIVRAHRGAIKVASRPRQGATLRVLFPISARLAERPGPPAETAPDWSGGGTVLVVDDEKGVQQVAGAILRRAGFSVLTADSGREALKLLNETSEKLSLVLLDLSMPGMDGEETFRGIHRQYPDLPVILSSGYSEQDAVNRLSNAGIAGFIQKPYRPGGLLERVRETMKQSADPDSRV